MKWKKNFVIYIVDPESLRLEEEIEYVLDEDWDVRDAILWIQEHALYFKNSRSIGIILWDFWPHYLNHRIVLTYKLKPDKPVSDKQFLVAFTGPEGYKILSFKTGYHNDEL